MRFVLYACALYCVLDVANGLYSLARLNVKRDVNKGSTTLPSNCTQHCNLHECIQTPADQCPGRIIKDECDCCPVCDTSELTSTADVQLTDDDPPACQQIECPRQQVCLLNIQGLPVCRCPSTLYCKNRPRRDVCADNGKSYRSACFLKIEACETNVRIKVSHEGMCATDAEVNEARKKRKEEKQQLRQKQKRMKAKKKRKARKKNKKVRPIDEVSVGPVKKRSHNQEVNSDGKTRAQLREERRREKRRHRRRLRAIKRREEELRW